MFKAQGSREIVPAAMGHDQNRQLQADQGVQVPMNGSVAAEQEHGIDIIGGIGKADPPLHIGVLLKRSEILFGTSPSQDRGGAHAGI